MESKTTATTTVRKDQLLAKVRENRDLHRSVFEAALEGYRARALELLDEEMQNLKSGRIREIRVLLSRPQDHTRDYDRIIAMLEMDVAEEVTLDEQMFAQYVMDDWRWKRDWLRLSNSYAAASTRQAYGSVEDEDL